MKTFLANWVLQPFFTLIILFKRNGSMCCLRLYFVCDCKVKRSVTRYWAPRCYASRKACYWDTIVAVGQNDVFKWSKVCMWVTWHDHSLTWFGSARRLSIGKCRQEIVLTVFANSVNSLGLFITVLPNRMFLNTMLLVVCLLYL